MLSFFDSLPDTLFTLIVEFSDYDGILFASLQKRKTQSAYLKSRTQEHFHDACKQGHLNVIKYLNPNLIEIRFGGSHAFHLAALNGHLHVIQYFVELGLTLEDIRSCDNRVLHLAALNGHLHVIQYFVEHGLTAEDIYSDDDSILHYAAFNGHQHVVDYLCDKCGIAWP